MPDRIAAAERRDGPTERRQFPRGGRRGDDPCLRIALETLQLSVSEQFDALIRRCGWSYAHTATVSGVSEPALTDLLKARGDQQTSTLVRLARALDSEVRISIVPKRPAGAQHPVITG
jgi:hypothetical protein